MTALELPSVPLADDVVLIRPWRADDIPKKLMAFADPVVQRFSWSRTAPYAEADARDYFIEQEEARLRGDAVAVALLLPTTTPSSWVVPRSTTSTGPKVAPESGIGWPLRRVGAAWRHMPFGCSPAPAHVADLGCGTGTLTVLIAQAGHVVAGLDLAPRMVALAREKLAAAGVVADVVVGDASFPPWQPGTFDVVLTRHVLWAMPDPEAALSTWIDLLAPGGRLILIEGRWSSGVGLASVTEARPRSPGWTTPRCGAPPSRTSGTSSPVAAEPRVTLRAGVRYLP